MGYALHNGVPASVSSFEAASTDLLFMYERVRTTPAPHRATVHTHTDTATRRRERGVVVRHVVVATLSQRKREREKGVGKPGAVLCESCSVFTNSTTTEKCDENRHIHREPTTASATVKAIFRQSFLLVPRIRYQRTTVAPYPHTVFHPCRVFRKNFAILRFIFTSRSFELLLDSFLQQLVIVTREIFPSNF